MMMKRNIIFIILLVLTLTGNAQERKGFGLFTDRDAYVSGETLLAKIYHPSDNLSKIVYLDLINPFGKRVSGASIEFKNGQASGFLVLPDSLSTGSYLLRSYLKNSAAKTKVIRSIWISNRFSGLEKTKQIDQISEQKTIQENISRQIEIEGIDPTYGINSKAAANIKLDKALLEQIDGPLLVSVAQTIPSFQSASYVWNSESGKEGLVEKKGIILSGTVTDKKTSAPVSGATVYMTVPDSIPGFQYYQTRTDGRFYFQMEGYYGSVQAFVQCFGNNPAQRLKITMDELFASPDSLPPFVQLPIQDEFKSANTQNIDAVTFQKVFKQDNIEALTPPKKEAESYAYYGTPSNVVNPQLFIDLPNFSEISKELLPGVKFRNYNNEPTLRVMNMTAHGYFDESPLLLIDGIPIRDLNVIKDMGTSEIKRVDILQSERFFGNLRFPGVVAIYTLKGDYSRIPDSDQFVRIKLDATQVQSSLSEPKVTDPNIPDLRQVFYWDPSVEPGENLSVKFTTSSVLGKFSLIVRSKLKDGTLIRSEKQFEVK